MRKSIHSESEMVKVVKELESGVSAEVVAREYGISKATLYQWKSKYSGMDISQVRRHESLGNMTPMEYSKRSAVNVRRNNVNLREKLKLKPKSIIFAV